MRRGWESWGCSGWRKGGSGWGGSYHSNEAAASWGRSLPPKSQRQDKRTKLQAAPGEDIRGISSQRESLDIGMG